MHSIIQFSVIFTPADEVSKGYSDRSRVYVCMYVCMYVCTYVSRFFAFSSRLLIPNQWNLACVSQTCAVSRMSFFNRLLPKLINLSTENRFPPIYVWIMFFRAFSSIIYANWLKFCMCHGYLYRITQADFLIDYCKINRFINKKQDFSLMLKDIYLTFLDSIEAIGQF